LAQSPRCRSARPCGAAARLPPHQGDARQCRRKRRRDWQKASGYNKRAKVEAAIGRWKPVIGDGLRSRIDERRVTEVNMAVDVLNRMLERARPNYVRVV
jgi:hypothetical protein